MLAITTSSPYYGIVCAWKWCLMAKPHICLPVCESLCRRSTYICADGARPIVCIRVQHKQWYLFQRDNRPWLPCISTCLDCMWYNQHLVRQISVRQECAFPWLFVLVYSSKNKTIEFISISAFWSTVNNKVQDLSKQLWLSQVGTCVSCRCKPRFLARHKLAQASKQTGGLGLRVHCLEHLHDNRNSVTLPPCQ